MAKARKLKVFRAQFGFYDTVVAAPSQAAALRVWGTRQNLFDGGDARLTTEAAAVEAALAHPGQPLRRPVGSDEAFVLVLAGLPAVPRAPKRPAGLKDRAKAAAPPERRRPADRAKLDAAEAALRTLDERRQTEEAALRREADALEAKRSAAEKAYQAARKRAVAALAAARAAYRDLGGTD